MSPQSPILASLPAAGRMLTFGLRPSADPRRVLARLGDLRVGDGLALGLGAPLVAVRGLRVFPNLAGPGVVCPSTQGAIWCFVAGGDPGVILHRARALVGALGEDVTLDEDVATFLYEGGRDLTGYVDGTENPRDARAREVAIIEGSGPGLDGGSFVATQRWVHDLGAFETLSHEERDACIGRHHETNEELGDAPPSAHVKRAAQESFDPGAFMLRRSMPFGDLREHGLYFVAYGRSLDAFERVLSRMVGLEDGVVDALFRLSRPVSGGYYFCPPRKGDGRLDLRALGG